MCVKCQKRIFEPREGSVRFAMEWKYKKKTNDLIAEVAKLDKIREEAVVTHLHCPYPEVDGFTMRMRTLLRIPIDADHPLLF